MIRLLLAILLSVGFIVAEARGYADFSFTRLFTGVGELPLLGKWGGWLSLMVFAAVGYVLVRGPFRKGLAN
ncbi:MAG: hypothetical protein ABIK62_06575 [candidate division WOR-3 bacterium]